MIPALPAASWPLLSPRTPPGATSHPAAAPRSFVTPDHVLHVAIKPNLFLPWAGGPSHPIVWAGQHSKQYPSSLISKKKKSRQHHFHPCLTRSLRAKIRHFIGQHHSYNYERGPRGETGPVACSPHSPAGRRPPETNGTNEQRGAPQHAGSINHPKLAHDGPGRILSAGPSSPPLPISRPLPAAACFACFAHLLP